MLRPAGRGITAKQRKTRRHWGSGSLGDAVLVVLAMRQAIWWRSGHVKRDQTAAGVAAAMKRSVKDLLFATN